MSCGCKTSGDSTHSCGTKSSNGCESVNTCGNSYKLSVFDWLSDIKNPSGEQFEFVEVRFKNDRKCFFRNIDHLPLHIGSIVTVESSPGHDIGIVSLTGQLVKIQMSKKKFPESQALKIYRLSTQKDIDLWQSNRDRENQTKLEARRIAKSLNLNMKITDVEYQGDGSKATFYYTADNRIDFRQLIKDLAMTFRTKIDMKQIGFRQETAKIGGIGSCGRELCCSSWLTDFRSVNTNAARYQQLSINPQKLAGQCGKLKCCLNYELDSYLDALNDFPPTNTTLDTVNGKAYCIKIDVFKKKMWFTYSGNSFSWFDLEVSDVKKMMSVNKNGEKCNALEEVHQKHAPVANTDLIQENNMDRFEVREKSKSRNNKSNKNKRSPNKNHKPQHNNQSSANGQDKNNRKPQNNQGHKPRKKPTSNDGKNQ